MQIVYKMLRIWVKCRYELYVLKKMEFSVNYDEKPNFDQINAKTR